MKKSIDFLWVVTFLLLACHGNNEKFVKNTESSTQDSVNISATIKINKSDDKFFAVCFDEHSGWCSEEFKTYDEAVAELQKHKTKTGHTDNTVSNDCITGKSDAINLSQWEFLKNNSIDKDKFLKESNGFLNPLYEKGIIFNKSVNNTAIFGGAGQINAPGQRIVLGGAIVGNVVNVTVSGQASVRIGMWFTFAQVAAGQWVVGGPTTVKYQLNCNVLQNSCPIWFGQPVTITAEGINGNYPIWVSFN